MKRLGEVLSHNFRCYTLDNFALPNQGNLLNSFDIEQFKPSLFQLSKHHHHSHVIYWFWFIITGGKYEIIYIIEDKKIIHYTHILPKFFKFPFMHKHDLEIGPSWTEEKFRGRGIFPAVIHYITTTYEQSDRQFYILVREENYASIKAIVKSGAKYMGHCVKSKFLGIYQC